MGGLKNYTKTAVTELVNENIRVHQFHAGQKCDNLTATITSLMFLFYGTDKGRFVQIYISMY